MLRLFFLSCFLILAAFQTKANAAIEEVLVHVDGLYCTFCAAPIEKKVRQAANASSSEVWLENGIIKLTIKPDAPFHPQKIVARLAKSSPEYRYMVIKAEGQLRETSDGLILEVPENHINFRLEDGDDMTLKAKTLLQASVGSTVTVTGRYKPSPGDLEVAILEVSSAEK